MFFFPSSSSYWNFIIKSRSHRRAESEELLNQIIPVDRRQNIEGQTRQLKKIALSCVLFFLTWLPFTPPQIMCLLPRWRWTLMEGSCRTTSPAEATALEGPSPLLCTTGSQLLDRTCSWTCILPLLWVRASLCSLLAQRASPRWRMMQDFTTACIRDLSVTSRPLLQLCPRVLGWWVFASFLIQYLWFCYRVWPYSGCVFWSVLSVMRGRPLGAFSSDICCLVWDPRAPRLKIILSKWPRCEIPWCFARGTAVNGWICYIGKRGITYITRRIYRNWMGFGFIVWI